MRSFIVMAALTFGLTVLMILSHSNNGVQEDNNSLIFTRSISAGNNTFPIWSRKLLNSGTEAKKQCSNGDIRITQGTAPPQPSGIPTYIVEITNLCRTTGCAIGDIKLYCAGFASANLINPLIFKHLPSPNHDYCIVNNGNPLNAGAVLSFHYNNNFMYKAFSVSSVTCIS